MIERPLANIGKISDSQKKKKNIGKISVTQKRKHSGPKKDYFDLFILHLTYKQVYLWNFAHMYYTSMYTHIESFIICGTIKINISELKKKVLIEPRAPK